jgi:lactate dehydrogenase-like 2-hydroxyacid dehydrogenase
MTASFFPKQPQRTRRLVQITSSFIMTSIWRPETVHLANGHDAVCVFVNDELDRAALEHLKTGGVQLVALRCAGYNNVDLIAADNLGIAVVRVPAYSPEAVAEHTVALILALANKSASVGPSSSLAKSTGS